MKNKMLKRLLFTSLLSLLLLVVSTILLISYIVTESTKDRVLDVVQLLQANIEQSDVNNLEAAIPPSLSMNNDIRISIFKLNGDPIYDSWYDYTNMDNHANRKEILAALQGEPTFSTRISTTVNEQLMYYAVKVENLTSIDQFVILRVAIVVHNIKEFTNFAIVILVIISLIIMFSSYIYLNRVSNLFFEPIRKLKENLKNINKGRHEMISLDVFDEELVSILEEVNAISSNIVQNLDNLSNEKEKIRYILDNLNQGILLINDKLEVVMINNFARKIFQADEEDINKNIVYLTRNAKVIQAVQESIFNNSSRVFDLDQHSPQDQVISLSISPIKGKWIDSYSSVASIVILTDVTEIKDREKIRSEFFANASHELNTPLTYIVGYSELMANGIIKDQEKMQEIGRKIYDESNRMKQLVEDMLAISKLESVFEISYETIALGTIAQSIVDNLKIQADQRNITIHISGYDVELYSNLEMIRQILLNLVDNAVKYNKTDGKVDIMFVDEKDTIEIVVSDSGIGIPTADQSRVFERFYRVDKARNKNISGTGLGLAIVKHIALKLNAEIRLVSEVGKGTTIRLIFFK